jgi:CO/xanthine dehydrogenase FAD-binding subunit
MLRILRERIRYANVVATLAMFVSLGGASYAAITFPAGSVGPRQLRAHAVELNDLNFPLGNASITDNKTEELAGACPPPTPGPYIAPDLVAPPQEGPTPGREVHLHFQASGRLAVSAIARLENESAAQTPILVFLELRIDQDEASRTYVTVAGGQIVQAPIQAFKNVAAGPHTAGLAIESQQQCLSSPGHLVVSNVSVSANAFPLN